MLEPPVNRFPPPVRTQNSRLPRAGCSFLLAKQMRTRQILQFAVVMRSCGAYAAIAAEPLD